MSATRGNTRDILDLRKKIIGQRVMKSQLRHLVAGALYPTKAYSLPAVSERYGLESGTSEAFSSKNRYVMSRLEKLSDAKVLGTAKLVVEDFPDDQLRAAIEQLDKDGHINSDTPGRPKKMPKKPHHSGFRMTSTTVGVIKGICGLQ